MSGLVPASRPKDMTRERLIEKLRAIGYDPAIDKITVVGWRGYFLNSMGKADENDRGVYDDAIFLLTDQVFRGFNGNTDPSRFKPGHGFGEAKGMAVLQPGLYRGIYQFDVHGGSRPHQAICQRLGPVRVLRDGKPAAYEHVGGFGINIHCGGSGGTSSLGCQTLPPGQWEEFIGLAHEEAKRIYGDWRRQPVTYALFEGPAS